MKVPRSSRFCHIGLFVVFYLIKCYSEGSETEAGWTKMKKYSYWESYLKRTWKDANDDCRQRNASLLDFKDDDDFDYLRTKNSSYVIWVELKKHASSPVELPSSMEDVLVFRITCIVTRARADGRWDDTYNASSHWTYPFICVKENMQGGCEKLWELSGRHCVLPVNDRMTWFGAYAHCRGRQAELFTPGMLETPFFPSGMKGRYVWTANVYQIQQNPAGIRTWSSGLPFSQWTEMNYIFMTELDCSNGCGYLLYNRTYLTSQCSKNRPFICGNEYTHLSHAVLNQRNASWEKAEGSCKANNRQLLQLNNQTAWDALATLDKENITRRNISYWFGLRKLQNNGSGCTTKFISNWTRNVTDYRLSKCLSVRCSNFLQQCKYEACHGLQRYEAICVKPFGTDDNCTGWQKTKVDSRILCYRRFEKVRLFWLAAYILCLQQNSRLINLTELRVLHERNVSGIGSLLGRCWVDSRKAFAPQDPLVGWHWLDSTPYNVSKRWNFTGRLYYSGEREKCAVVRDNKNSQLWEDRICTRRHHFICKKLPEAEAMDDVLFTETMNSTTEYFVRHISCQGENCATQVNRLSFEEILSSFSRQIMRIVNTTNSSVPFKVVNENFELSVYTTSLKYIRQWTSNVTTVPINTIESMCQDRQSCAVKSVTIKMKDVTVNSSKLSKSTPSALVDVVSFDYIANGRLITGFDENETISMNFSTKISTTGRRVFCVFLDGIQWSQEGMKVGSTDGNAVKCITNHLSSFTVVILDAELSNANEMALKIINYIGSGLSLAGLVLTSVVYLILYKDLQILETSRHLVHLNLQIALGLTQIAFLAGGSATHNKISCKIVAILVHYFSLAAFCWMLLEAAMLYLKLISVFGGEFVRMRNFFAFGWGIPLIFVGLSSGLNIDAYGTAEWCWLSYKNGFVWLFFAPVIIVTSVTFVVLIAVARVLFYAAKNTTSNTKKCILSAARGVIILFPTLGLSWAFSIVAINHDALVWKYLFAITSSTQGFLIFLIYGICNREIRVAVRRRMGLDVYPTTSVHS